MKVHREIADNQLYLYINGKLIYKHWLNTDQSMVFDVMAYDKHTLVSIKNSNVDKTINLNNTDDTGILAGRFAEAFGYVYT